jgi:hypothetical protein
LDKAQQYGLELNPVVAWTSNNVRSVNAGGNCGQTDNNPTRNPIIDENNAYAYGQSVAEGFGTHPAIAYWVFGGDDINSCDSAQVWINMRNGLRTADNGQPTTYHTGGDYNRFKNESWNEFLSPQTGWGDITPTRALASLKAETGKVTYAAEMRYYLDGGWTAAEVGTETQIAFDDGVDSMVYGDIRRAFVMMDTMFYAYPGSGGHIRDTFNSPGEDAFFGVVGS